MLYLLPKFDIIVLLKGSKIVTPSTIKNNESLWLYCFNKRMVKTLNALCGFSGFADGRHEVSPDSEEIEQTWTEGSIAKLSERGANPRQVPPMTIKDSDVKSLYWIINQYIFSPIIDPSYVGHKKQNVEEGTRTLKDFSTWTWIMRVYQFHHFDTMLLFSCYYMWYVNHSLDYSTNNIT